MKIYGIYLTYSPMTTLEQEGLGRHLIEFLKGAQNRGEVYFVIACPSWMRASLKVLFDGAEISGHCYEFLGPRKKPLMLVLYEKYKAFKERQKREKGRFFNRLKSKLLHLNTWMERKATAIRSPVLALLLLGLFVSLLPLLAIAKLLLTLCRFLHLKLKQGLCFFKKCFSLPRYWALINKLIKKTPEVNGGIVRMYQFMLEAETGLIVQEINQRTDIQAWYCPTSFWPVFNTIKGPKLVCVPDVVLTDFPIGFSLHGGERHLSTLKQVETTIQECKAMMTYSEEVKWNVLVRRFHKDPNAIHVVKHGANRMDEYIRVSGFPNNEQSTEALCRHLFYIALGKICVINNDLVQRKHHLFAKNEMRFIFYASQFRPNKNVMTLLRAFNYLLKEKFLSLKLVLTGNPYKLPEIRTFILENNLENDVLCLHGLTASELAACYYLADLAVNPSLSEGGCPFTLTEALSVDTPVVMSQISVTEEVIQCPELKALMLFDPYDWQDMAHRIEWGVNNQALLLQKQKPFYEALAKRTWKEVVEEYMDVLDRITADHLSKDGIQ